MKHTAPGSQPLYGSEPEAQIHEVDFLNMLLAVLDSALRQRAITAGRGFEAMCMTKHKAELMIQMGGISQSIG